VGSRKHCPRSRGAAVRSGKVIPSHIRRQVLEDNNSGALENSDTQSGVVCRSRVAPYDSECHVSLVERYFSLSIMMTVVFWNEDIQRLRGVNVDVSTWCPHGFPIVNDKKLSVLVIN
jgi:hypothetical protein